MRTRPTGHGVACVGVDRAARWRSGQGRQGGWAHQRGAQSCALAGEERLCGAGGGGVAVHPTLPPKARPPAAAPQGGALQFARPRGIPALAAPGRAQPPAAAGAGAGRAAVGRERARLQGRQLAGAPEPAPAQVCGSGGAAAICRPGVTSRSSMCLTRCMHQAGGRLEGKCALTACPPPLAAQFPSSQGLAPGALGSRFASQHTALAMPWSQVRAGHGGCGCGCWVLGAAPHSSRGQPSRSWARASPRAALTARRRLHHGRHHRGRGQRVSRCIWRQPGSGRAPLPGKPGGPCLVPRCSTHHSMCCFADDCHAAAARDAPQGPGWGGGAGVWPLGQEAGGPGGPAARGAGRRGRPAGGTGWPGRDAGGRPGHLHGGGQGAPCSAMHFALRLRVQASMLRALATHARNPAQRRRPMRRQMPPLPCSRASGSCWRCGALCWQVGEGLQRPALPSQGGGTLHLTALATSATTHRDVHANLSTGPPRPRAPRHANQPRSRAASPAASCARGRGSTGASSTPWGCRA